MLWDVLGRYLFHRTAKWQGGALTDWPQANSTAASGKRPGPWLCGLL